MPFIIIFLFKKSNTPLEVYNSTNNSLILGTVTNKIININQQVKYSLNLFYLYPIIKDTKVYTIHVSKTLNYSIIKQRLNLDYLLFSKPDFQP